MTTSLEEIDRLLSLTEPVDASISPATLRQWRTEIVRASVNVSYAIGVLSLDIEVLTRSLSLPSEDVVQSLLDELPGILASGWVGGGWSLSPDASASVAAAAEIEIDQSESLLELHAEMAESELGDPAVVRELLARVEQQRQELADRRDRLEHRVRAIQVAMRGHYATGAASTDDWIS